MVTVALAGDPRFAPLAPLRVTPKVSFPSYVPSSMIGTVNVLFALSPTPQFKIPPVVV
jgi:hypothetical protein